MRWALGTRCAIAPIPSTPSSHAPIRSAIALRDRTSERLRECTSEAIGDRTSENRSVGVCQVASVW
ncbi:MAG: hypothetical protein P5700_18170 [Arthrospira platensis PCC 7345]|uniref:hypothetical protein n=1 Tax=Limnospira platensis TaxID=118562 RepID=UPI0028E11225|nr:hypothetical protein [Arthrospira platensis PCC 7345]